MWYRKLLSYLAATICQKNKKEAISFINDLLDSLVEKIEMKEEPQPTLLFGLITTLYQYYENKNQLKKDTLDNFSQLSFGLAVLHSKNSSDCLICCSDFTGVLISCHIFQCLNAKTRYDLIYQDFLEGKRAHPHFTQFQKMLNGTQRIKKTQYLSQLVLTEVIKDIEFVAFRAVDYEIRADLKAFRLVFNQLLDKQDNQQIIIQDLLRYLEPFKQTNEKMDDYISDLESRLSLLITNQQSQSGKTLKKELKQYVTGFLHSWFYRSANLKDEYAVLKDENEEQENMSEPAI